MHPSRPLRASAARRATTRAHRQHTRSAACAREEGYQSEIDCTDDHFADDCALTVGAFERCTTAAIEATNGVGRDAIDCSLAGTDAARAALVPWVAPEECRLDAAAAASCSLDDH